MGEDVDVGILDRRQGAAGQLFGRLPTPGMDAGNDDVEAGEQLIGVVQGGIGADLELGPVQDLERCQ